MSEQAFLKRYLADLKAEHRSLDGLIGRLSEECPLDQIKLQRLKKRKLQLKDMIARLESRLLPDIIA